MRGSSESELLDAIAVEAPGPRHAQGRGAHRSGSEVTRAALAGLVVGLGILVAIASAGDDNIRSAGARASNRVGDVVGPSSARAFVALDVSSLNGLRAASLPWRFGRAAFLLHCKGGARVLDADVWGLASGFTYRWVISDAENFQLVQSLVDTPSIGLRISIGAGTMERLVPDASRDYLRLVTRLVFAAPLDGAFARPLLVVNGQTEDPGLGWVVAAPDDVVTLLRQPCGSSRSSDGPPGAPQPVPQFNR